ncbi:MAG: hypothetical protein ACQCN4_03550 [Candidatus Bathyarchaeia archaeon]
MNLRIDLKSIFNVLQKWLGSLTLALYMLLGTLLLLLSQRFWVDNFTVLGKDVICSYSLTTAIALWLGSLPAFVAILLVTQNIKNGAFVAKKLTGKNEFKSEWKAIFAALINGVAGSITYVCYIAFLPELVTAFSIAFTVINIGILCVSTFYYLAPLPKELMKSSTDPTALLEALKLEHSANMGLANNVVWVTVILLVSVVFLGWTQVIYPSVDATLRLSIALNYLQAITVIQLAYLCLGVWFGVLSRLWDRAWRIAKEIADLKLHSPY